MKPGIYILIILIVTCKNILAQNKIGCVYSDSIIQMMPEVAEANITLRKYQDSLSDAAQRLEVTLNKRMSEWINCHDCPRVPDSIRKARKAETIEMVTKLQNMNLVYQQLAKQKAAQMFITIKNKFNAIVKQVAEENGYRYVLDLSDQRLQFMPLPQNDNITDLILRKLNL